MVNILGILRDYRVRLVYTYTTDIRILFYELIMGYIDSLTNIHVYLNTSHKYF